MAKLYFKYGAMGSSKSAQALITKYNYEERGRKVWLIKPKTDTRDGQNILKSRIGLFAVADEIALTDSIKERFAEHSDCNVIIADEAQFLAPEQIDELRDIVDDMNIPVMCFGLRTDFITKLFPGSMRLFEVADSITEIKTICDCGAKATVNARMDDNGRIVTAGDQICIGGNDRYIAMCHKCWKKAIAEQK